MCEEVGLDLHSLVQWLQATMAQSVYDQNKNACIHVSSLGE